MLELDDLKLDFIQTLLVSLKVTQRFPFVSTTYIDVSKILLQTDKIHVMHHVLGYQ